MANIKFNMANKVFFMPHPDDAALSGDWTEVGHLAASPPLSWDHPDATPLEDLKTTMKMMKDEFGALSVAATQASKEMIEAASGLKPCVQHLAPGTSKLHDGEEADCTINCCVAKREHKKAKMQAWVTTYGGGGGGGFAQGGYVSGGGVSTASLNSIVSGNDYVISVSGGGFTQSAPGLIQFIPGKWETNPS